MILINEIIEILSSDKPDLNNALFKTKVLLHRLGEAEAITWVNSELNGYPNIESVPDYRKLNISVYGNLSNGYYDHNDQPLQVAQLDEKLRKNIQLHHLLSNIAVIESYAKDDKHLTITIAPELFHALGKNLPGGWFVDRAWGKPSLGSVLQVVTEVRSRLLDFILDLSEKLPEELDESEMKQKSKEIGTADLFNNAVFGDNATIFVGSHNVQSVQNNVVKNDFESLAAFLRNKKIEEADVQALKVAIDKDNGSPEHNEKKFGSNVRSWVGTMLIKATESAWNVNLGIASSLIANALNAYYGWF